MRYSICITTFNNVSTIENSLRSLFYSLKYLDRSDFEVVVVDSESTDGSTRILRTLEKQNYLRLVVKKCSKGRGRQLALEASKGLIIISGFDTDDELLPDAIQRLVAVFDPSRVVWVRKDDIYIGPRELFIQAGWDDLYAAENVPFKRRLEARRILTASDMSLERPKSPHYARTHGWKRFKDMVRTFWIYAGLGMSPKTSWKSEPLWKLIKAARKFL